MLRETTLILRHLYVQVDFMCS